ncbi:anti-sigma factor [Peteryoungia ipomoeae]|uniref:Regulator of SigK n=1 Tax=Peteryoungia ipomoeae TaxID=1210932 RepID=A0A4S8P1J8_9HYPH|nr:anti-sigma factor [Peteryoungia ipomoeae]THV23900.1 anti-sigma factor [Peteryoungia ipomoeae]
MSTPDQSKGDRSRDEVLAGEYVLGVLTGAERLKVDARLRHDRQFAAMVRRWEENLTHFNEDYAEVAPPDQLFSRIEERLFVAPAAVPTSKVGLWNSLVLWRGLSLVSLAALGLVVGLDYAERLRPKPQAVLTADLAGNNQAIALHARYDGASGRLSFTPVASGGQEEKSLELWLVEGEQTPISLGVLPQTGQGELDVPQDMRARLTSGVVLAVSLEPYGGSPTGQATGPVIALGEVRQ